MDKLFYNLPEELQDKIRRMNKHPVAELFHEAINLESYYYYRCGDHSNNIWYKILGVDECFTTDNYIDKYKSTINVMEMRMNNVESDSDSDSDDDDSDDDD